MSTKKLIRDCRRALERDGFEVVEVGARGNTHVRLTVRDGGPHRHADHGCQPLQHRDGDHLHARRRPPTYPSRGRLTKRTDGPM